MTLRWLFLDIMHAPNSTIGMDRYCFRNPANIRSNLVVLKINETSTQHNEWNKLIRRISETGLVAKWSRLPVASASNAIVMDLDSGFITLEPYNGCLVFVALAWLLATLVAILEQVIHYKVKKQQHHR